MLMMNKYCGLHERENVNQTCLSAAKVKPSGFRLLSASLTSKLYFHPVNVNDVSTIFCCVSVTSY